MRCRLSSLQLIGAFPGFRNILSGTQPLDQRQCCERHGHCLQAAPEPEGATDAPEEHAQQEYDAEGNAHGDEQWILPTHQAAVAEPQGRDDQQSQQQGRNAVDQRHQPGDPGGCACVVALVQGRDHGPFQLRQAVAPLGHLADVGAGDAAHAEGKRSGQAGGDDDGEVHLPAHVESHEQAKKGERAVEAVDHEVAPHDRLGAGDLQQQLQSVQRHGQEVFSRRSPRLRRCCGARRRFRR